MKKLIIFSLFIAYTFGLKAQTCKALFSYGAQFEKVSFVNQSSVSNAHYYWNFGDGTSSYLKDPTHEFPGNGIYLVTLYVNDLVTNCSDYYDVWLNITKYSTDPCSPQISDSIYTNGGNNYLKIIDYSSNCNSYPKTYYSVGGNNLSNTYYLGNYPANYISYVSFNSSSQLIGVKTSPFLFYRSKNYQDCSANFEFSVVSEDSGGQRVLFKAMNRNAKNYNWTVTGFGSPIYVSTDTISAYYSSSNYSSFYSLQPFVYLKTTGQNGCVDSLKQGVVLRKKSVTYVGIKEQNPNDIKLTLIPNPVKDRFTLDYEQSDTEINTLTITNTLGQLVFILNEPKPGLEIDISYLTGGIYYLIAENKTGQKTFKVLKE